MIAVILAAGRGERLRPLTDNLPKGLIMLNSKSLLEHSLYTLAACAIKKVIIVVGYKASEVKLRLGPTYAGMELFYVENQEYAASGSMLSLYKAREFIHEDILLLESDLVFEREAIDVLVHTSKKNVILVAPNRGNGDQVFICIDTRSHLIGLGKQIENEAEALGELVGLSKLSLQFLANLCHRAEIEFERNGKNISYEDTIMLTVKDHGDVVDCIFLENLLWTDIDNENDFKRATKEIFPRIAQFTKHRDSKTA